MNFEKMNIQWGSSFLFFIYVWSIGVIYQSAYWSVFNINIFEFASSLQLLQISFLSAAPVMILLYFAILNAMAQHLIGRKPKPRPAFGREDLKGFFKYHAKEFLVYAALWIIVVLGMVHAIDDSWAWLAGLGVAFIMFTNAFAETIDKILPGLTTSKKSFLFLILFLPILAFCCAKYRGNVVFEGKHTYINASDIKNLENPHKTSTFGYIGKLDKYIFLHDAINGEVIIVFEDQIFPLKIHHNSKASHWDFF